ncbi:MAG: hypothetical protein OWT28_00270 [Firmicutes bacterium]|nr:hypothetical protein [Bacillota bacterium]
MDIAYCADCGRLFQKSGLLICKDCLRKQDALFETVKAYIREHGQASMAEISEALDVPVEKLIRYMQEGRLILGKHIDYPCERCGNPIHTGRMCEPCMTIVQSDMAKAARDLSALAGDARRTDAGAGTGGYRSRRL